LFDKKRGDVKKIKGNEKKKIPELMSLHHSVSHTHSPALSARFATLVSKRTPAHRPGRTDKFSKTMRTKDTKCRKKILQQFPCIS
jgi:hypothetical protein